MLRIKSKWSLLVGWMICLRLTCQFTMPAIAQSVVAAEGLDTAINRLDSPNPDDWDKSQATLMASMKNPTERERATCALAIFHIKRGNAQAIANLGRQLDKLFPKRSADVESQLLRIQLWHDLATEQTDAATKHFSQLLDSTLKGEVSKVSSTANAALLGSVVGMLELDAAQSLIPQTQLSNANSAIKGCQQSHLSSAFSRNHDKAVKYAQAVDAWLQANGELTIEEAAQAAQHELAATQAVGKEHRQIILDERTKRRELVKSLNEHNKTKKLLSTKIMGIQQTWKQNPQLNNLVEPDIRRIQVPLTERVRDGTEEVEKTRWVTGKDGKREKETYYKWETKYKDVRKSAAKIEAEVRSIFEQQMFAYTNLKNMRDELLKNKAELDKELKDTLDSIQTVEGELDSLNQKDKSEDPSVTDLKLTSRVISEALKAQKTERRWSAFRPPSFEIFDYAAEEKALSN